MSKYQIVHSCGHDHTYNLLGKHNDRDRKAEWLADQPCPECRRAADKAARESQNLEMGRINRENGAVPLDGTDAQVGWAESIRATVFQVFAPIMLSSHPNAPLLKPILAWLMDQSSSAWWIDNWKSVHPGGNEVQQLFSLVGGKPQLPPNPKQVIKHFLLEWPDLTASLADSLGISLEHKQKLTANAQKKYEEEKEKNLNALKEADIARARDLGITGKIEIWRSRPDETTRPPQKRVYADAFTYFHEGFRAGTIENKTGIEDSALISFAKILCAHWKAVKLDA
ncbi:MAG: hypothetical protein LBS59_00995 [Puniceicoccales bacterium]|nr:hypothetical protein [Puniceicoccales bacterium]